MALIKPLIIATLICSFFQLSAQSPADGWTVGYPEDQFTNDALLDLSYLNENIAGENGFIKLSPDGVGFVNGNGEEMRFWAIGGGDAASRNAFRPLNDQQLAHWAKFLAKKGVNMIRYHGAIFSVTNDLDSVNAEAVEDIWRLVAAMKNEGIYTTISPFWAGHMDDMRLTWDLGDYSGNVKPWALMFFEPKFKNAYKKWVEYLYTEQNPFTGIALKNDPAVAIIQIKNEDGLFWWSIQDVKPSLMALMETQFHDWLINKYGTINNAYAAWDNLAPLDTDNPSGGKMGIYIIWEATIDQTGGKHKRVTDQIEFYSDVQRGFYQEIYDHYRSIGCQQLINGNNWKTASALKLFDAERWTNTVGDVMAVNRYYSPQHIGENSGWRIEPNHQYVGKSVLFEPHKLPINVKQVVGKPFIVSESAWNLPHKYQAEGPFLISAYMSLTGFDGYYWFSPSSPSIDPEPYWDFANVNGQVPMFRWTVSTPGQLSMFPANALMYRKGYIQKGNTLVHEERTLQSIYEREIPIIGEENSFDPNRDSWDNTGEEEETELPPIAYLAGPVTVKYDGDPNSTSVSPQLDNLLDFTNKKITSVTEELVWDYKNGICLLDAPKAQGICGFPGQTNSFQLSDVTIKTTNDYITVNVIPLDDLPINQSENILIQIGTIYRPNNWAETAGSFELGGETVDGFTINNVGSMPWKAANNEISVIINNPNIQSAHMLDNNGYEKREISVQDDDDSDLIEVKIPSSGMYFIADARPANVLGVDDELEERILIYPNPSNGSLMIETPKDAKMYNKVEVRDLTGRLLIEFQTVKNQYDLGLPGGTYLITLKSGWEVIKTTKIFIDR